MCDFLFAVRADNAILGSQGMTAKGGLMQHLNRRMNQ
jgi:hypothetical protein